MASNPVNPIYATLSQSLRRPTRQCLRKRPLPHRATISTIRSQNLSTTSIHRQEGNSTQAEQQRPLRWATTPVGMKAPVRIRPLAEGNDYIVNEDPRKLDKVYKLVLGEDGDKFLSEEVKWLAVTHKSFDQGRRGYNDRLAFFGKRIIELQVSLALLSSPLRTAEIPAQDEFKREPFRHPALDLAARLDATTKTTAVDKPTLANLAYKYGLLGVVRWKPKNSENLKKSGSELVLAQAMYAIVGAVSLTHGGEVAARIVRERILIPLGVK
ncbi:hypothetical protein MMC25_004085 [Agyrium rufum]|nr:hypothetical protein [Agyrium rufum]